MPRLIVYALCAGLAPAVSVASILLLLHAGFGSYWPLSSDDVIFNHQIRTFTAVGFSGGYYTVSELPAPASFTHFGPHGPLYPALYGLLLRPFGVHISGPIWVHHGMMYTATLLGLMLARPGVVGALSVAVVISTFWPAISMLTVSMQEGLHFSIAILAATAAFTERRRSSAALFVVASLIRPTWALGLITLIQKRKIVQFIVPLGGAALLSVGALLAFRFISAPAPRGIIERVQDALNSSGVGSQPIGLAAYFGQRVFDNLTFIVSPPRWQLLEGQIFVVSAVVLLLALWRRTNWRLLMSALALVITIVLVVMFYDADSYRGFRTLGPFTLLALVTSVLSIGSARVAVLLVCINLLFVGSFVQFVRQNRSPMFSEQNSEFARLADDLSKHMRLDIAANPWCNTVLIDRVDIGARVAAFPPGFGLSVVADPKQIPADPKSAFVMLSPDNMDSVKFPSRIVYKGNEFVVLRNLRRECKKG